jgi:hypothetical protein
LAHAPFRIAISGDDTGACQNEIDATRAELK